MKTNIKTLWFIALILGWFWDFLFWEKKPGISFAIFVLLCVCSGLFLLFYEKRKPSIKTLWLLAPITIFAIFSFIRQEPISLFLSISCTLLLLLIIAMSILGGNWLSFGFGDYFMGFLRLWKSITIHPLMTMSQTPEPSADNRRKFTSHQFWQVLRGILIALPVLAIFTVLLSSADAIFAQKLGDVIDIFSLEKLPEYIMRLITILIIAYVLVGVFYHAIEKSFTEILYNENGSPIPPFLGITESSIVLGSVILLFAAFVSIQFRYFFGGQANINIDGYTYSEYARRGFGELLAVAVLTLLLLLIMSQVSRRENSTQLRIFSSLTSLMVALVGIILISAFDRLLLYESVYGFTRLRTYTHVFIIWLGVLLLITVLLEIFHRFRFFANATLLVGLGFALTINLMNVDGFIVQRNVQRATHNIELDTPYLAELSTDAVPTMIALYQSPNLPSHTRDSLGASLACMNQSKTFLKSPAKNWQSFELSTWWAGNAMQTVEDQLAKFKVIHDSSGWHVTGSEGQIYWCESSWLID